MAFIANLMDGKVDFVCCDMPEATRLTIHVLAAVAEHEREMIAKRTRDGLRAARERGAARGGGADCLGDGCRGGRRASVGRSDGGDGGLRCRQGARG